MLDLNAEEICKDSSKIQRKKILFSQCGIVRIFQYFNVRIE